MSNMRVDTPGGSRYGQAQDLAEAQATVSSTPKGAIGVNDPQPEPSINRPTEDLNESLFAGSRIGPGPGPEALASPVPMPDPDEEAMASIVPILEGIVDQRRNSSARMRQLVRKYRSELPVK
jgi:hypothetical protein